MTEPGSKSAADTKTPVRWLAFLPVGLFALLALLFFVMLGGGRNPQDLPSALTGRPAPIFALEPVEGLVRDGVAVPGFSDKDLRLGKVTVVNIFASWCGPCREEHPQMMALATDPRISVKGINQRDKPHDARRFLGEFGNPYSAVGADPKGRTSIDWGVYGVPETFILRGDGTIAFKKVGPISAEELESLIKPEIEKALK